MPKWIPWPTKTCSWLWLQLSNMVLALWLCFPIPRNSKMKTLLPTSTFITYKSKKKLHWHYHCLPFESKPIDTFSLISLSLLELIRDDIRMISMRYLNTEAKILMLHPDHPRSHCPSLTWSWQFLPPFGPIKAFSGQLQYLTHRCWATCTSLLH